MKKRVLQMLLAGALAVSAMSFTGVTAMADEEMPNLVVSYCYAEVPADIDKIEEKLSELA